MAERFNIPRVQVLDGSGDPYSGAMVSRPVGRSRRPQRLAFKADNGFWANAGCSAR